MTIGHTCIRSWDARAREGMGETVEEFLERLGGPAWLRIPGLDSTRTRAISTLLHGNEPSGVRALYRWLRSGAQPAVNLVCVIGAVEAALAAPGFANRFPPGRRDLNRCFREPFDGTDGAIARGILERLRMATPEALVDVHNTSGAGPAYAVSTRHSARHDALTTLFSRHLILTDLRLGTLMEATEDDFPTITVECGGARDPQSDAVAAEGLFRYATADSILAPPRGDLGVTILKHPIRVELCGEARVAYAPTPAPDVDVTFRHDVDRYNFGVVRAGERLGWVGSRGLAAMAARDAEGRNALDEIFTVRDGCLELMRPTRFFMITTDPNIARSDCLFYVIPADET